MTGQKIQRGFGHGNLGTAGSIWSSSSESEMFSLKYGIVEFSFGMSCWSDLHNL